jgi:hypothetical protein
MSRDEAVVIALVVAFATLVTAHLSLVAGLARRPPWWRALAALVVPPLAPYWGLRDGLRMRSAIWIAAAAAYAVTRFIASR